MRGRQPAQGRQPEEMSDSLNEEIRDLRAGDVIQRLRSLTRPREAQQEVLEVNALLAEALDMVRFNGPPAPG